MKKLFYKLPTSIREIFRGKHLVWQLVGFALTYALVMSGFDWWYFRMTRGTLIQDLAQPAVFVGFFFPIIMVLLLWLIGILLRRKQIIIAGFAAAQAGLLGLGISSLYKVFTGRSGPHGFRSAVSLTTDISHGFRFGFYRGGAFQGWPSSHTATAYAMSFALITLLPKKYTWLKILLAIYALYIGIGVSVNIHWFSDFIAGAILGTVIGISVGKTFKEMYTSTTEINT